jgi:photosystem II stability/assembly factor-like uncharacterized protein
MKKRPFTLLVLLSLASVLIGCQFLPLQGFELEASTPTPFSMILVPPSQETTPGGIETPTSESVSIPLLPRFDRPAINDFAMFTPSRGWAVTEDRDHLLVTFDGGQSWLEVTPPDLVTLPTGYISFGIDPYFLDENTTWFTPTTGEGGFLFHTRDGGVSWTKQPTPFSLARYDFLDLHTGYALVDLGAGAGSQYVAIYRTLDGGMSWTMVFTHEPGAFKSLGEAGSKNGITFRDAEHGWMGGAIPMADFFYLYTTVDGGETWSETEDMTLPGTYAGSMLDVGQPIFIAETTVFLPVRALSLGGDCFLLVYRSDDGGNTWRYRGSVADGLQLDLISADEGWLAAGLTLQHTTDGGLTWLEMSSTGIPGGEIYLKVDFVDSQHGWVLTTPDEDTWARLYMYQTRDGGASWTRLMP